MKHSIRGRFTLIFVGLMAAILLGIWGVNNWLLEGYYVDQKVTILQTAYESMDRLVMEKAAEGGSISDEFPDMGALDSGEQTEAVRLLQILNDKYNITTLMVDGITNRPIVSSARDAEFMLGKILRYILMSGTGDSSWSETILDAGNYMIQKTYDNRSKSYFLECWGYFSDNKTIFILSAPLDSIGESVKLANRFLAYVGLIALLVGSLVIYFAAKRVTSPILKLADLSKRMSALDFDAKFEPDKGHELDEIGVLGGSMNALSDQLCETIGQLQTVNDQLQKDIEEKTKIDEQRREFIANVSHELKTPIALIQGYAEGLVEGMAEEKESRDYYCEVIMDEANKMNLLVRQLLTLSALEFGNDTPVLERFDLVELIRGVLSAADILIQQKEAQVEFDDYGQVFVTADEFKLEQVVTNYLNNALNHLDGERRICIRIMDLGDRVRVSVANTGTPIPEEDIPNLWGKFYKVDKARTRAYGGSGIGLSIVKAILDAHKSGYGVNNRADGVEFWFEAWKEAH